LHGCVVTTSSTAPLPHQNLTVVRQLPRFGHFGGVVA
jgi:hypothetical protein